MGCPVGESGGGVCGGHGLCDVGDDPTNTVCDDSFFFFFFQFSLICVSGLPMLHSV